MGGMLKGDSKAVTSENQRSLMAKGMPEKNAIMVSMKNAKKPKVKDNPIPSSGSADYPYGLGLDLNHESLNKLGIDKLPGVGSKMKFMAHAKVQSTSEDQNSGDTEPKRSMRMQITHMKVHP